LRTILLDPEGRPLYKITTSDDRRTTSLSRKNIVGCSSSQDPILADTASEITLVASDWSEFSRIRWDNHSLSRTLKEVDDSCFDGKSIKREFIFNATGCRYKWSLGLLGAGAPVLTVDDYNQTVIARLHRAKGFINPTKAYLEVEDEYLDVLDAIILSLVYVEKKRKFMQEDDSSISENSRNARMVHSVYRA